MECGTGDVGVREVAGVDVGGDGITRCNRCPRRIVDGDEIQRVDIADIVAEFFHRSVIVHKPVVFPLNILQFGVDITADFGMQAQLVGEIFEAPRDIFIACASGDTAVLAVDERRVALHIITGVVEA